MDTQEQVEVIYTDLFKALNSTDYGLLLYKLKAVRFNNYALLVLLQLYLLNYQFNIAISGVSQGSNLGPLIFILFVNLSLSLGSKSLMYSDDTKLF